MSREYADAVDRLIAQERSTLNALTAGDAPDLDAINTTRSDLLEALKSLGPAPDAPRVRSRLKLLLTLNSANIQAFSMLRERCGRRLGALGRGQRRLSGYQNALQAAGRRGGFGAA